MSVTGRAEGRIARAPGRSFDPYFCCRISDSRSYECAPPCAPELSESVASRVVAAASSERTGRPSPPISRPPRAPCPDSAARLRKPEGLSGSIDALFEQGMRQPLWCGEPRTRAVRIASEQRHARQERSPKSNWYRPRRTRQRFFAAAAPPRPSSTSMRPGPPVWAVSHVSAQLKGCL